MRTHRPATPDLRSDYSASLVGFSLVVLLGIFSSSTVAPSTFGDMAVILAYVGFIMLGVSMSNTTVNIRRIQLVLLLIVIILLVVNVALNPTAASFKNLQAVRVPAVLLVTLVNLYYIPRLVPAERAMWVIALTATVVILLGIPSLLVGPHSVGWIKFEPYTDFQLPFLRGTVPALTSFYADSNAVSKLAVFGSFASLYMVTINRHRNSYAVLLVISLVGLYLGHSRGAMIALFSGVVITAIFIWSPGIGRMAVTVLVGGAFIGFGMLSGILPAPQVVSEIPLSSRGAAWQATFDALADSPLLGYGLSDGGTIVAPYIEPDLRGLSPQNSFLYMTLATGIFGGLAYLLFVVRTLFLVPASAKPTEVVLIGMCVAVFILHFFEILPLFGVNQNSILASLSYGYFLQSGREPEVILGGENDI